MTPLPSLLLVDDDADFLESLAVALYHNGITSRTCMDSQEAINALKSRDYDCAVIDYHLGDELGTSLIDTFRQIRPGIPIIIITAFGDIPTAVGAMQEGASDFIEKPFPPLDLVTSIENVIRQSSERGLLKDRLRQSYKLISTLTARERQVVDAIVAGKTSREIAEDVGVSPRTVEAHRANILAKLGLDNTAALVRVAVLSSLSAPNTRGN